jgi:putative membrane protein
MSVSAQDRERVAAAIRAAEARSSGEIVCVLAHGSTDAIGLSTLVAAVAALALPWILVAFTALSVHRILILQVALFAAVMALFCLPAARAALLPRRARRAVAHRAAMEQFVVRGIARKKDRSGVLVFVSLAEHYARVIADEGIAAKVPQKDWQGVVDVLVAHIRDDRIGDGFVAAVELCGDKLAQHFPRTDSTRDELPDRLYLI